MVSFENNIDFDKLKNNVDFDDLDNEFETEND